MKSFFSSRGFKKIAPSGLYTFQCICFWQFSFYGVGVAVVNGTFSFVNLSNCLLFVHRKARYLGTCFDTLSLSEISFCLPHFSISSFGLSKVNTVISLLSFSSNFFFFPLLNYFHQLESSKQNSSDRGHSLVPESHGNFSCFQPLQMMLIFGLMDV